MPFPESHSHPCLGWALSGEHRTSYSPVVLRTPPQTNAIKLSKIFTNSQEWGTKAQVQIMALQIRSSYTSYKHLCPPVGQTAGRVLFSQTICWSDLALTCLHELGS